MSGYGDDSEFINGVVDDYKRHRAARTSAQAKTKSGGEVTSSRVRADNVVDPEDRLRELIQQVRETLSADMN